MTARAMPPSRAKEAHKGRGKKVAGQDAGTSGNARRPAQEIADDEVEIGKTGGKPGAGSAPSADGSPSRGTAPKVAR